MVNIRYWAIGSAIVAAIGLIGYRVVHYNKPKIVRWECDPLPFEAGSIRGFSLSFTYPEGEEPEMVTEIMGKEVELNCKAVGYAES